MQPWGNNPHTEKNQPFLQATEKRASDGQKKGSLEKSAGKFINTGKYKPWVHIPTLKLEEPKTVVPAGYLLAVGQHLRALFY